jgi:hypothetical protein
MGTLDTKINFEKYTTIDNTFSNADTFPKTVYTPAAGKRVIIADVIVGVVNSGAAFVVILVQAFINGAWQTILPIGVLNGQSQTVTHSFDGRVQTDLGGGIRLQKAGTSASFNGVLTATGKLT